MDVSKTTVMASQAPPVAKVTGNVGVKPAASSRPVSDSKPVDAYVQNTQKPVAEASVQEVTPKIPDSEAIQALVEQANDSLSSHSSDLKFSVAEGTNINVVRVEDTETGEIIRQFPSETMVAIARALEETTKGNMLKETA